ncbi:MAG: TerC family protein [Aestuariivirga sp.]
MSAAYLLAVTQIIWIDLLLSGDNAVVIAMACRSLPEKQRRIGILLGAGAAVGLRIAFAFVISQVLGVPFLKTLGGLLLIWIAIKLVCGEEKEGKEGKEIAASDQLWKAVGTIAMADAVMSLDNVVAIAAIARENYSLFIFGLALSIPLIVIGAALITNIITKFPIFVWAGAALLGWIAGEMIIGDAAALAHLGLQVPEQWHYAAATCGAVLVVAIGYLMKPKDQKLA